MSRLPSNPSASTVRRNPHLYPRTTEQPARTKRVRQSSRGLNKLEREFLAILKGRTRWNGADAVILEQSITLVLANGVRYTPDLVAWDGNHLTAYEVKGAHAWEDAMIKLKFAPQKFSPPIRFVLAWKQDGAWHTQEIIK